MRATSISANCCRIKLKYSGTNAFIACIREYSQILVYDNLDNPLDWSQFPMYIIVAHFSFAAFLSLFHCECGMCVHIRHPHYLRFAVSTTLAYIGSVCVRASHTFHETQFTCVLSRECNNKTFRCVSLSLSLSFCWSLFWWHFSVLMLMVFISDKVINVVNFICPYFFCYCTQFTQLIDIFWQFQYFSR